MDHYYIRLLPIQLSKPEYGGHENENTIIRNGSSLPDYVDDNYSNQYQLRGIARFKKENIEKHSMECFR